MQLTFKTPHLSIIDFPAVELPAFTLITGVNGAGKTHLLKAIDEGKILADIAPQFKTQARFFDWTTLIPQDQGVYDGHRLVNQRNQIWTEFEKQFETHTQLLIQAACNAGLPLSLLQNPTQLARLTREEISEFIAEEKVDQAMQQIDAARNSSSTNIRNSFGNNQNTLQILDALAQRTGQPIVALQRADFFELSTDWGRANIFQQSFAQLFVAYRDLKLRNKLKRLDQQDGDKTACPLSSEEFESKYNIPPHRLVNEILK